MKLLTEKFYGSNFWTLNSFLSRQSIVGSDLDTSLADPKKSNGSATPGGGLNRKALLFSMKKRVAEALKYNSKPRPRVTSSEDHTPCGSSRQSECSGMFISSILQVTHYPYLRRKEQLLIVGYRAPTRHIFVHFATFLATFATFSRRYAALTATLTSNK